MIHTSNMYNERAIEKFKKEINIKTAIRNRMKIK